MASLTRAFKGDKRNTAVSVNGINDVRKCSFTLIELLVVISIVALLASLLLPALKEGRRKALLVSCTNNERQIYMGTSLYTNDYNGELPSFGIDNKKQNNRVWDTDYDPDRFKWDANGKLWKGHYVERETLLCPDFESSHDPFYGALFKYDREELPQSHSALGPEFASSNYTHRYEGLMSKRANECEVMLAEAVCAQFNACPAFDFIDRMHGGDEEWAYWETGELGWDTPSDPVHGMGLGTMNMTLYDGSTHSVPDWADIKRYPWLENWHNVFWGGPSKWPETQRTWKADFWPTFDAYFGSHIGTNP